MSNATQTERTFHIIPLTKIQESPFNPRKTFTGIDELADNIAEHGVLQPVLVRPVGSGYEIVFGARRFRASKKAKMTHIPCEIRELDDATALELCVVENCQRIDVHPLEEAEGYEMLRTKHKLSVDDIAAKVNKSVAQIYARMKLLDLIPEARKAFYDGKLTAGTAIQVARLAEAVQKDALKELMPGYRQGDPLSVREAAEVIGRRFHLKLADAPFDRNDATLVPKAGACGPCPKRTGNQTELFPDVKSRDTCTDAKCFDSKRDASWKARVKEATKAGVKVIPTEQHAYSIPNGYIDVGATCYADPKKRTFRELLAKVMPEQLDAIWRAPDGKIAELLQAQKSRALLLKAGHKFAVEPEARSTGPSTPPKKPVDQRAERVAAQLARNAIIAAIERKNAARGLFSRIIHELDLGGAVGLSDVFSRRGISDGPDAFRQKMLGKMRESQLRGIAAEMMMGVTDNMSQHLNDHNHETIKLLADEYGVDLKKIERTAKETIAAADKAKADAKKKPAPKKPAKAKKSASKKPAKKKGRK